MKEDVQVLSSLEVAEMVGRRHDQVLRDIATIIGHLSTNHKSVVSDYFMESSYEENLDYVAISQKRITAQGNETTYNDHAMKLDMAKQLGMLQRTEEGRRFILELFD